MASALPTLLLGSSACSIFCQDVISVSTDFISYGSKSVIFKDLRSVLCVLMLRVFMVCTTYPSISESIREYLQSERRHRHS